jgi:thiamine-phosphate pyrophosphorylase
VGALVGALARGGAELVQLRAKALPDGERLRAARAAVAAADEAGIALVVNDRVDVALLSGAHGVHLGQDDLPPRVARELLGARALLGLSTHTLAQLERAADEPVDYVAFGPVLATPSKENADPVVGVAGLAEARRRCRLPLVAIGGITPAAAGEVARAGADGLAVIAHVMAAADPAAAVRALRAAVAARNA